MGLTFLWASLVMSPAAGGYLWCLLATACIQRPLILRLPEQPPAKQHHHLRSALSLSLTWEEMCKSFSDPTKGWKKYSLGRDCRREPAADLPACTCVMLLSGDRQTGLSERSRDGSVPPDRGEQRSKKSSFKVIFSSCPFPRSMQHWI